MKLISLPVAVLFLAVCLPVSPLQAQGRGGFDDELGEGQPAPPTVTKVYDVGDLVAAVPDRRFDSNILPVTRLGSGEGEGQGGGGGLFASGAPGGVPAQTSAQRLEDLARVIQTTVDPNSWRDAGGTVGAVKAMDQTLVVTQTQAVQDQIADLLKQLRQTSGRMVRVRATWALLTPEQLQAVLKPAGAKPGEEKPAGEPADAKAADGKPDGGGKPAGPLQRVDGAALDGIKGAVRYRGQTTAFSGQTVHLASGRARTIVTDVHAVVGAGAAAYEPVTRTVLIGATLQLTPQLSADGSGVMLDLSSVVSEWDGRVKPEDGAKEAAKEPAKPAAPPAGTAAPAPQVERLNIPLHTLGTTVRIPLDTPVLVGGMTFDPGGAAEGEGKQLYLIVEAFAGK